MISEHITIKFKKNLGLYRSVECMKIKKVIYNDMFMTVYQGNIKAYDYDPPRVGKNNGSYQIARAFTKFEL